MFCLALALLDRSDATASHMALTAALRRACVALFVKITLFSTVPPEQQLMFQMLFFWPVLLFVAVLTGALLRDPQPIPFVEMAFQAIGVARFGFLIWLWLLTDYPAWPIASFSFLPSVFAVILGWLVLHEDLGLQVWDALALVSGGIFLINSCTKPL